MMRTVIEMPNGMRIIVTENSNPYYVLMVQRTMDKINGKTKN
jgi:hypothetical protein